MSGTLTVRQVAAHYGVGPRKIIAWLERGELVGINVASKATGRPRWRISQDALQAFERRRSSSISAPGQLPTRRRQRDSAVVEYF
jgi:transposase